MTYAIAKDDQPDDFIALRWLLNIWKITIDFAGKVALSLQKPTIFFIAVSMTKQNLEL